MFISKDMAKKFLRDRQENEEKARKEYYQKCLHNLNLPDGDPSACRINEKGEIIYPWRFSMKISPHKPTSPKKAKKINYYQKNKAKKRAFELAKELGISLEDTMGSNGGEIEIGAPEFHTIDGLHWQVFATSFQAPDETIYQNLVVFLEELKKDPTRIVECDETTCDLWHEGKGCEQWHSENFDPPG